MDYALPILGVSGRSETGKTGLVCELIEGLSDRGYEAATIKHSAGDFSLDREGKDTWRHSEAGAGLVVFSTAEETDFLFQEPLDLEETVSDIKKMGDFDIVLIEGMKEKDIPKIDLDERGADEQDLEEILERLERKISISKILDELPGINCKKCGYESCEEMAVAIFEEDETLDSCVSSLKEGKRKIDVSVDGEDIVLGKFPKTLITSTIKGMMSSLKGVGDMEDIEEIEINISEVSEDEDFRSED
ncbi:MAG: molybdopterin-guanine dinucleotide biosynthesis protein B [Candidatus Thermoplasmatota archaeon]|nr:molybdopterin-guanine dinucleotide biosynthesis protein B [Candidatus Thermoplasmatota archaeon]